MNLLPFIVNAVTFKGVLFWLVALVVFILMLGIIILIHEGGHFFFAKKAGILCHEFAIGMGPVVKTKKKGETSYSIRAIPVGGFVSMAGEDTNESILKVDQEVSISFKDVKYSDLLYSEDGSKSDNSELVRVVSEISVTPKVVKDVVGIVKEYDLYSKEGDEMYIVLAVNGEEKRFLVARDAHYIFSEKQVVQMAPYERCYESKTKTQRFLTVFAGPFMNFVLAFFIFLIVGLCSGVPNDESTVIGELSEGYPASAYLKEGDEIISINGTEINNWDDISKFFDDNLGVDSVNVTFIRDGVTGQCEIPTVQMSFRIGLANYSVLSSDKVEKGLVVTPLMEDYVAHKAGVGDGDILLGYYVGDTLEEINSWKELYDFLDENPKLEELKIQYIDRKMVVDSEGNPVLTEDGKIQYEIVDLKPKTVVTDVWSEKSVKQLLERANAETVIGISPATKFSFFGGIWNGLKLFWHSITTVFVTLGALFGNSQVSIKMLSGPVGIFGAVKQYLTTDVLSFLSFFGLISANIGLVNLLPLPALDGGRLIFLGYEAITRKKVNKKVETTLINIVFWLVIILFIYVTFNDILRLF